MQKDEIVELRSPLNKFYKEAVINSNAKNSRLTAVSHVIFFDTQNSDIHIANISDIFNLILFGVQSIKIILYFSLIK